MNDTVANDKIATAPSEQSLPIVTKRGRKPETLEQRLERARQAMQGAERAIKEAERRKLIVVGSAVLAEAEADGALRNRIADILRRRVKTAQAKADVASLLIG